MIDGMINVYKEKGYTSHDVVAKMRGILKMKKVGHTGTLDPDAEGVLPVCIGKGTKLADMMTDRDKTYEAVCKLGITTDTQDITGRVLNTAQVKVNLRRIEEVLKSYIGEYLQLPPMYSAVKVDGKRLYELARQGREIKRERRRVLIKDIRLLDYRENEQEFKVFVSCGKGTYIRTLLHDIGDTLGCGAAMKSLLRTAVGNFRIEYALRLSEIEALAGEGRLEPYIVTPEQVFCGYFKLAVNRESDRLVHNGNAFLPEHSAVPIREITSEQVRVYDSEGRFVGIYRYEAGEGLFKPVKMFL